MQIALRPHNLIKGIVERAQIGIDFTLQIAGKKAELLTRFHRGTRENNALAVSVSEGAYRHGHREIGFSGTCRAYAEGNHALPYAVHIFLLSEGLRLHRPTGGRAADELPVDFEYLLLALRKREGERVVDRLLRDCLAAPRERNQILEDGNGLFDLSLLAHNLDTAVTLYHRDLQGALNFVKVDIHEPADIFL